jgi:hypothetical protein
MVSKTAHFSLRLDPKLKQAATQAAADDHRPLGSLIKKLLSDHCEGREPAGEAKPPSKRGQK